MTNDAVLVLTALFSGIWRIFTSWNFPGTKLSPAELFIGFLALAWAIKFFKRLIGTYYQSEDD